jgi:hypothetical protein
MFYLPIPFFLFQLQYWEITTWATTAIIFLPTFLFGLMAIFFLGIQRSFYLLAACITGMLAAFSAGNGFFVFPVGFIMLLLQRRMRDLLVWTIFSLCFIIFYAFLYTSQGNDAFGPGIFDLILDPFSLVCYFMAAVGSAGGLGIKIFSIISGIILTLWFLYLTQQRYFNRNPVIYFFMVFLLLTALAIALKRSSYGIDLILLTSRYRLISILLLVSASISFLEIYCDDRERIHFFKYTLKYSIALFFLSYLLYLPFLAGRYHELATGINGGLLHNNHKSAYDIINLSVQKGVYSPPAGFLHRIDPGYTRNAESKINNFTTRFNQVHKSDMTFTLRFNIPNGNILDTNMHVLLQKPEVIYLFNSGLTPTSIRKVLHNVEPDDFKSDIYIKNKDVAIGKDAMNAGK